MGEEERTSTTRRLTSGQQTVLILFGLLLVGFVVRLPDLGSQPLGFHPTRQYRGALIARAIYLDQVRPSSDHTRQVADREAALQYRIEPEVDEHLAALTYQVVGHESLWAAKLVGVIAWLLGAIALYRIMARFAGLVGVVSAVLLYLFAPLGVAGSRSFQPDPIMVMGMLFALWLLLRHDESPTWGRLVAVGAATGACLFVKPMVAPGLFLVYGALSLRRRGWKRSILAVDNLVFIAMAVAPTALYYLVTPLNRDAYFIGSLVTDSTFWHNWYRILANNVGLFVLLVGIVGAVLAKGRLRWMAAALWAGYLASGIMFDYRTATHSYYHLQLIPILAVGWGVAADWLVRRVESANLSIGRPVLAVLAALLVVVGLSVAWNADRVPPDGKSQIARDQAAAAATGHSLRTATMTLDYGKQLAYVGGVVVLDEFPEPADVALLKLEGQPVPTPRQFLTQTAADFLVVTHLPFLEQNPALQRELRDHYRLHASGAGWRVYDLRHRR